MIAKVKQLGQAGIGTILGVGSLFAALAAPILYVGNIKETNAVQDEKIETTEMKVVKIEEKLEKLVTKDDLEDLKSDLKTLQSQQAGILQSLRSNPNY